MGYSVRFEYQEAYAEVSVWDDDETATLVAVYSKFRQRGAARKVLERAIEYCELMELDLVLEVMPFGEAPKMTAPELKAFYMSLGFEAMGSSSIMMKRFDRGEK